MVLNRENCQEHLAYHSNTESIIQPKALTVTGLHLYVAQCKGIKHYSRAAEIEPLTNGGNKCRRNSVQGQ